MGVSGMFESWQSEISHTLPNASLLLKYVKTIAGYDGLEFP